MQASSFSPSYMYGPLRHVLVPWADKPFFLNTFFAQIVPFTAPGEFRAANIKRIKYHFPLLNILAGMV
jgi:hypothetical protein